MKKPNKTEIWSRQHVIFSYLPLESYVTERNESELSKAMTSAVLQNELDQRLKDPAYLRDTRIKFLRDGHLVVWARVYSKPGARMEGDALHCTGTYCGITPSARGVDTFSAMDASAA